MILYCYFVVVGARYTLPSSHYTKYDHRLFSHEQTLDQWKFTCPSWSFISNCYYFCQFSHTTLIEKWHGLGTGVNLKYLLHLMHHFVLMLGLQCDWSASQYYCHTETNWDGWVGEKQFLRKKIWNFITLVLYKNSHCLSFF